MCILRNSDNTQMHSIMLELICSPVFNHKVIGNWNNSPKVVVITYNWKWLYQDCGFSFSPKKMFFRQEKNEFRGSLLPALHSVALGS